MPYTFIPEKKHARAFGRNMRISRKAAVKLCRVMSQKPLTRAKRLLVDVKSGRRDLKGKYYSNAVAEMLALLESCEKNADNAGLDAGRLFVHASAHQGAIMRRRRRKSAFGSRLKSTNVEIILIEKGKGDPSVKIVRTKKQLEAAIKETATQVREKAKEKAAHAEKEGKETAKQEPGTEAAEAGKGHENKTAKNAEKKEEDAQAA